MLLILEGPDNTLKTPIGKRFAQSQWCKYFKFEKDVDYIQNKDDAEIACYHQLPILYSLFKALKPIDVVCDRFYPTEYVYGKVFRPASFEHQETEKFILSYDEKFAKTNAKIFLLYRPVYSEQKYEDEYVSIVNIQKIKDRYFDFIDKTCCQVVKVPIVDDTDFGIEQTVAYMNKKLDMLKTLDSCNYRIFNTKLVSDLRVSKNNMPGYFSGQEILFCGQNPGQSYTFSDGFVDSQNLECSFLEEKVVYYQGLRRCKIGNYISEMLKQLNLDYTDISFTNVVKYSTKDNTKPTDYDVSINKDFLLEQINILQPKKIVTIGNFAHDFFVKNNIEHIKIHHPASHAYNYSNIKIDVEAINASK